VVRRTVCRVPRTVNCGAKRLGHRSRSCWWTAA